MRGQVIQYLVSGLKAVVRQCVSSRIKMEISKWVRHFHLTFDDVYLTHFTFDREFRKEIEAKQEAGRQRYVVEKTQQ
jgi:prohibitin 1